MATNCDLEIIRSSYAEDWKSRLKSDLLTLEYLFDKKLVTNFDIKIIKDYNKVFLFGDYNYSKPIDIKYLYYNCNENLICDKITIDLVFNGTECYKNCDRLIEFAQPGRKFFAIYDPLKDELSLYCFNTSFFNNSIIPKKYLNIYLLKDLNRNLIKTKESLETIHNDLKSKKKLLSLSFKRFLKPKEYHKEYLEIYNKFYYNSMLYTKSFFYSYQVNRYIKREEIRESNLERKYNQEKNILEEMYNFIRTLNQSENRININEITYHCKDPEIFIWPGGFDLSKGCKGSLNLNYNDYDLLSKYLILKIEEHSLMRKIYNIKSKYKYKNKEEYNEINKKTEYFINKTGDIGICEDIYPIYDSNCIDCLIKYSKDIRDINYCDLFRYGSKRFKSCIRLFKQKYLKNQRD